MKEFVTRAVEGEVFSKDQAYQAMGVIMSGEATPAQIAGFLVALRMRGETPDEIAGFARGMQEKALHVKAPEGAIDTCGTGGDGAHTLNLSTAAALVAASLGVPVAKHGNRSVSSSSGSADVLAALGIPIENPPEKAEALLSDKGFAFLFAPIYHPAMKFAIGPRRELGVRTVFNILGPLTSPAGVKRQVIGVFHRDWLQPIAEALVSLGKERALVAHGEPGLDEFSTSGDTMYILCENGCAEPGKLNPSSLGVSTVPLDDLKVGSAEESAKRIVKAFEGADKGAMTAIGINAAGALWVAGTVESIHDGFEKALQAMEGGTCREYLELLRRNGDSE